MSTEPEPAPAPVPASKSEITFQRMLASMPSRDMLQAAVVPEPQSPEEREFQRLAKDMAHLASEDLAKLAEAQESDEPAVEPRWCVCEAPEGEFSRVRMFADFEKMIRYLGKQEGEETSIWPFIGVAMRFTRELPQFGDVRFLLLPGEKEVVAIPKTPAEPIRRFPVELIEDLSDDDFQDNGWLGIAALAEGRGAEFCSGDEEVRKQKAAQAKRHQKKKPGKGPDDESGDHSQEDGVPK